MSTDWSGSSFHAVVDELGLADLLGIGDSGGVAPCDCDTTFEAESLVVEASDCDGDLAASADCRAAVVQRLADRDARGISVRSSGVEYRYGNDVAALFSAAGRFLDLLGDRDERLAEAVQRDPLAVAEEASQRADQIGDIGDESGLVRAASSIGGYDDISPTEGLDIAYYFVDRSIGDDATLSDVASLDTGSTARLYERPDGVPLYALDVVDLSLTPAERSVILDAYEAIADGIVEGDRAASRAIEHVSDQPVEPRLSKILAKHTSGYGILEDLFADSRISDVFATSPVGRNPLRVVADGDSMTTNVYLTETGSEALGSRVRRTSGRAFSRAKPTVDATANLNNGTGVRIAGVTDPVADGVAFAFRERVDDTFTLPELVANGTMGPRVAGFLSVAIERNAAALIAGTRGAGKTTLLGTLLYELTANTRTVVIEDTPELPISQLQDVGRDVQALRTGTGDGPEISPADALRTALRLGDGALVVGEIRGEEAQVLYEAMRVGANANAVLGTIHGDGADEVYERVISDLNVEPSSFGSTDLVVTVQAYRSGNGRKRRVARIEEVIYEGDSVWFEPLFALDGDTAAATGRIDRGESRIVDLLAGPTEAYADVREAIQHRGEFIATLASDGRTNPRDVATAYAERQRR